MAKLAYQNATGELKKVYPYGEPTERALLKATSFHIPGRKAEADGHVLVQYGFGEAVYEYM
jgi:hypothetical protein